MMEKNVDITSMKIRFYSHLIVDKHALTGVPMMRMKARLVRHQRQATARRRRFPPVYSIQVNATAFHISNGGLLSTDLFPSDTAHDVMRESSVFSFWIFFPDGIPRESSAASAGSQIAADHG